MTYSFEQARDLLRNNPSVYSTLDQLMDLVKQVSVDASIGQTQGRVTVLYSGALDQSANPTRASSVVTAMKNDGADVRILDKTQAFELLDSREFKEAVAKAGGFSDFDEFDKTQTDPIKAQKKLDLNNWLFDGKTSPWAEISGRFVSATTGEVRLLTAGFDSVFDGNTKYFKDGVMYQTELPALLEKLKNSDAITKIDGLSRADLLKVGAAYSTNWTDAMRHSVLNITIAQNSIIKPTIGNYSQYLNITPEQFAALHKTVIASELDTINKNIAKFEMPSAARRALTKLGVIGGLVGFSVAAHAAEQADAAGDSEKANEIMKEWAIDSAGSTAGSVVAGAVGAAAVSVLAAAGVAISAPFAGAIVLGAALVGGIFGGEGATDLYKLLSQRDAQGQLNLLEKMSDLLFGVDSTITTPLPADLNGAKYTIDASMTRDEMVRLAQSTGLEGIAWRYALRELNPFVITDISYTRHNTSGSLDLFDKDTNPSGLTNEYLIDRAAMLAWKLQFDKKGARDDNDAARDTSKPYNEDWDTNALQGNWDFIDMSITPVSGLPLQLSIDGAGLSLSDHQVVFGSKNADTINGSGDTDRLYGMRGDDTLDGKGGDDYLEGGSGDDKLYGGNGKDSLTGDAGSDTLDGGEGNDTLAGGTGHDRYRFSGSFGHDIITDSDGDGAILTGSDGQTLRGQYIGIGKRNAYAVYLGDDKYAGLAVYEDNRSSTGHRALITLGTDTNNTITINNFDLDKAASSEGYLGIKLAAQRIALVQGNGQAAGASTANVYADTSFNTSTLDGKTSQLNEGNGKSFTISLANAAKAGDTITLNITGALANKLQILYGGQVIDANGAVIALTEGDTLTSIAFVSDEDIDADQLGSVSATYNGEGSSATSNSWSLTLKDAGESDNTLTGDFLVQTEKASADIRRIVGTGQIIFGEAGADPSVLVVKKDELYYERDGQGNLIAGTDQPTQKPIYGEVDGQQEIVGYEDIPSDDAQVNDNALFGSAGKDKILGLSGSDLLSGGAGNDVIEGGAGDDLIAGGKGADRILGGDGDDFIASASTIDPRYQAWGKDDLWKNWGIKPGEEAALTNTLWGVTQEAGAGSAVAGNKQTYFPKQLSQFDDSSADSDGDVIDAGKGDDWVLGSHAGDRIQGGIATNSTAHYAANTTGKCSKRFKNLRKTTPKHKSCKKFKRNQPLPVIQPAQSAIEFVVTGVTR